MNTLQLVSIKRSMGGTMRRVAMAALVVMLALFGRQFAAAEPCAADNIIRVAANDECVVIQAYGKPAERTTLVVFIHGDTRRVADYMYPYAKEYASRGVVTVGLIRPGYSDSAGSVSTGGFVGGGYYSATVIETIAAAVKTLKEHYKAEYVILVGRSGGAAVSGIIIGKYPGLAGAAVLGACPCDVPRWRSLRSGEGGYGGSLSPHNFADGVAKGTKVIAITSSKDSNTIPALANDYVNDLKENGIDATFIVSPEGSHGRIEYSPEYRRAVFQLLEGRSFGELERPKEKARSMLSGFDEHFSNALARYRAAGDCMARDRKTAEGIIREMLSAYRKGRDPSPKVAAEILRASLDNYFRLADVALSINCADVADDQYRTIKRFLKKVDMPAYAERLNAAMAGLK